MKKNILQIITIVLCAVLIIMVSVQDKKIDGLTQQLNTKTENLRYEMQNEISNVSNTIRSELEESNRIALSKELKPTGINQETKKLLAKAVVSLKEWYADTKVTLYVIIGGTELSIEMMPEGAGVYSCPVEFPGEVDSYNVIELAALISGGGLTKKESLGAWGDVSMLLPLRSDGGGWSGPTYGNGVMSSQFSISIVGQNGMEAVVNNPEFWVYKNGELVQQLKAVEYLEQFSGRKNYAVASNDTSWSVECEPGDNITVRFRCEDAYGLGYDFLFADWVATEGNNENTQSAGVSQSNWKPFMLYWPE